MDCDLLEVYVVTLIEMIRTGDHNCYDAIKKFRAFARDMDRTTEIVAKQGE